MPITGLKCLNGTHNGCFLAGGESFEIKISDKRQLFISFILNEVFNVRYAVC